MVKACDKLDRLCELLRQFNLIPSRSAYELGSAHFYLNVNQFFPEEFLDQLDLINRGVVPREFKDMAEPLPDVISKMIRSESSLEVDPKRIISYRGSTRDCLDYVIDSIIGGTDRTLSFSLPNWHFWHLNDYRSKDYDLDLFEALNEEQLVDEFKRRANKGNIGVLILSDPNTPLMYRLSPEALKEIDEIALKNGVEIVVDDVLRGIQPLGERESIAKHLTRPYVVEGFSKRFGENSPLAVDTSYVVVPEGVEFIETNCEDDSGSCHLVTGGIIKASLSYLSEPIMAEYLRRNEAFDSGFAYSFDISAKLIRPSSTHITSIIELPPNIEGFDFCNIMYKQGVNIFPIQRFYPEYNRAEIPQNIRNLIRVSVGQGDSSSLFKVGRMINEGIFKLGYSF